MAGRRPPCGLGLAGQAGNLARVARSIGKHVHVGRVSSLLRSRIARDLHHAHTVDGTFIKWAPDKNLAELLHALLHFDEPEPPCDVADWGFDQQGEGVAATARRWHARGHEKAW